jgi:hypothetical protein
MLTDRVPGKTLLTRYGFDCLKCVYFNYYPNSSWSKPECIFIDGLGRREFCKCLQEIKQN